MILVLRKVLGKDWESRLAKPSPAAGARKAPVIQSRRHKSRNGDHAEESGEAAERPKSKGSSRRSSRSASRSRNRQKSETGVQEGSVSSRHAHHRPKGDGAPMALILGSLGVLVVAGVVGAFLWSQGGDEPNESTETTAKNEVDKETGGADLGVDESGDLLGGTDSASNGEKTAAVKGDDVGETNAAKTSKKSSRKRTKKPPMELTPFDPSAETSEEEMKAIEGFVTTLKDINATRKALQAQDALVAMPKKAIPYLINAMTSLDLADKDDARRGWTIVQALAETASRSDDYDDYWRDAIYDWQEVGAEGHASSVRWRRKGLERWWSWWKKEGTDWSPPKPEEDG